MRKRNKVGHVIRPRLRERKAFDRSSLHIIVSLTIFYAHRNQVDAIRNRVIEGRWVAAIIINEAQ